MKLAFLYAGQGSQKVGMGKDFYDEFESYRNFIDSVKLDYDYKTLMHEGPLEELSKTENTQGCMAAFAAGVTKLLEENGIKPEAATGLSLGEYGALYAAGVFPTEEYVKLTAFRGRVMMEAAKGIACAMSAILGLESSKVEKVCKTYVNSGDAKGYVTIANYNCPGQYVICGEEVAVADMENLLKEAGAKRCIRVNVSGPFHTKYMEMAGKRLLEYFAGMNMNKPLIPVAMNVTGEYLKADESVQELLNQQVQSSVKFENDLITLLNDGFDTFVEIGPGNTLSGFLKKTAKPLDKEVTVYSIDTVEDFKKVINELNK